MLTSIIKEGQEVLQKAPQTISREVYWRKKEGHSLLRAQDDGRRETGNHSPPTNRKSGISESKLTEGYAEHSCV